MANPERGEVALEINATKYVLKMSFNAICIAEKLSGMRMKQLFKDLEDGSFTAIRALFSAGISHQVPNMTLEHSGDLIQSAGVEVVLAALTESITIAFDRSGGEVNPS